MVYKVYDSVVSVQSLENTVISLGELRENRESGGESAAKRREERPPAASGTRWGHVLWRRGSEWFLKQLTTSVLQFPYLSFQCTSARAGPPSSAPEQFSWTVNRNRVTGCGHMAPLDEALPGTPLLLPQPTSAMVTTTLLLPQPALSHGGHTTSTTASPQPWWPHPFSNTARPQPWWPHPFYHSQPSAMVATPLLQHSQPSAMVTTPLLQDRKSTRLNSSHSH